LKYEPTHNLKNKRHYSSTNQWCEQIVFPTGILELLSKTKQTKQEPHLKAGTNMSTSHETSSREMPSTC